MKYDPRTNFYANYLSNHTLLNLVYKAWKITKQKLIL